VGIYDRDYMKGHTDQPTRWRGAGFRRKNKKFLLLFGLVTALVAVVAAMLYLPLGVYEKRELIDFGFGSGSRFWDVYTITLRHNGTATIKQAVEGSPVDPGGAHVFNFKCDAKVKFDEARKVLVLEHVGDSLVINGIKTPRRPQQRPDISILRFDGGALVDGDGKVYVRKWGILFDLANSLRRFFEDFNGALYTASGGS